MEPDFDKEIDALLRKETAPRTITISEFAGGLHLDADEITAFAEKKVPPGVRDSFIEHFAACDRCRKVLLNAAWLNAEEEQAEYAGVAAPVEILLPWYRRLFHFPNLAYVMGSLMIIFAGFIGVSVYTSLGSRNAVVSQADRVNEMPTASGPAAAEDYAMNTNSAVSVANAANSAGNVSANTAPVYATPAPLSASNSIAANARPQQRPEISDAADARSGKEVAATAPPPPAAPPQKADAVTLDGVDSRVSNQEKRPPAKPQDKERRIEVQEARPQATAVPARSAPQPKAAARNDRAGALAAESDLSQKKIDNLPTTRDRQEAVEKKQVRGRTFELRQGVWYETSYRGQGTVNVRRNTEDYRKLDRGLRGIAESLMGTVVTIWNGKAYRIY